MNRVVVEKRLVERVAKRVAIQGIDEAVLATPGQWFADRAGPRALESDGTEALLGATHHRLAVRRRGTVERILREAK